MVQRQAAAMAAAAAAVAVVTEAAEARHLPAMARPL